MNAVSLRARVLDKGGLTERKTAVLQISFYNSHGQSSAQHKHVTSPFRVRHLHLPFVWMEIAKLCDVCTCIFSKVKSSSSLASRPGGRWRKESCFFVVSDTVICKGMQRMVLQSILGGFFNVRELFSVGSIYVYAWVPTGLGILLRSVHLNTYIVVPVSEFCQTSSKSQLYHFIFYKILLSFDT